MTTILSKSEYESALQRRIDAFLASSLTNQAKPAGHEAAVPPGRPVTIENPSEGSPCITPPASSIRGGEDTVVVGFYVDWVEWSGLREVLESGKLLAQEVEEDYTEVHYRGQYMHVKPKGAKAKHGPMFRYLVDCDGYSIKFMDREKPVGDTPNVMVDIGSCALMEAGGLWPLFCDLHERLVSLGGHVIKNVLSRLDICVDLVDWNIADVVMDVAAGQGITRARAKEFYQQGNHWSGVSVGKEPKLRIYDKLLEVKKQPEKKAIMIEKRWGGKEPESAVRVEFQVRRKFLNSAKVRSVEDYYTMRGQIVQYLVRDWFRLAVGPVDRTHTTDAEISEFWKAVDKAFQGVVDFVPGLERVTKRKVEQHQLEQQGLGCIVSSLASTGYEPKDWESLRSRLLVQFENVVDRNQAELRVTYQERVREYAVLRIEADPVTPDDISFYFGDLSGACNHVTARDLRQAGLIEGEPCYERDTACCCY